MLSLVLSESYFLKHSDKNWIKKTDSASPGLMNLSLHILPCPEWQQRRLVSREVENLLRLREGVPHHQGPARKLLVRGATFRQKSIWPGRPPPGSRFKQRQVIYLGEGCRRGYNYLHDCFYNWLIIVQHRVKVTLTSQISFENNLRL